MGNSTALILTRQLWLNLLRIVFPPSCSGCATPLLESPERGLCPSCAAGVRYLISPLCPLCGTGLSTDGGILDRWCRSCLQRRPPFDSARSLLHYSDPARTLLHRLKFKADTRVVPTLRILVEERGDWLVRKNYDLIVPVPLFPARLKKRGLNQALVLARVFFAGKAGKIDPAALKKTKNTPAQSGLSGPVRRSNLLGSISHNPEKEVAGRRICLVDDIYTTGATVSECSTALKEAGAAGVDVVTFARAANL